MLHRVEFEKYKTHVGRMANWYSWPAGKKYPSTIRPFRTSVLHSFSSYENINRSLRVSGRNSHEHACTGYRPASCSSCTHPISNYGNRAASPYLAMADL